MAGEMGIYLGKDDMDGDMMMNGRYDMVIGM